MDIPNKTGGGSSVLLLMWDASKGASGEWTCTPTSGAVDGASLPVVDTTSIAKSAAEATAQVRFDLSGIAAGSTRVLTMPNINIDLGDIQANRVLSDPAPNLTTAGQIAIDNTGDVTNITTSVLNIHDGTDELFLFGVEAYPTGDNQIQKYDLATKKLVWEADAVGGAGSGHDLQYNAGALATQPTLNFTGTGVSCADTPGTSTTTCTFSPDPVLGTAASLRVDSAASSALENNAAMNPTSLSGGWNTVNPNTVGSTINSPCGATKPCFIGKSATYPDFVTDIYTDWQTPGSAVSIGRGNSDFSGFDTYGDPGQMLASYSSINGADDTMLNAQLSTSLGCRHCLIGPTISASGHLYVGPGGSNAILGEVAFGLILGGNSNTLIGPSDGTRSVGSVIAGGEHNKIDMAGITSNVHDNVIGGGTNNIMGHVGTNGVSWSIIEGGATNTIINSSGTNLEYATINGGKGNRIVGNASQLPAKGSTVGGVAGIAWLPYQNVYGGGDGYNATDNGTGAIQTFDLIVRQDISAGTSVAIGLWPSTTGSIPKLQYAGVYTLSGVVSCQSQTDITSTLPTKLETWEYDGVMMWTGGAAVPQFVSNTDGTADNIHNLVSTMTVGGVNTWEAAVRGASNGGWYTTVATGLNADAVYCQGDLRVIQSRQDTTP
jgi:hypothetical protein